MTERETYISTCMMRSLARDFSIGEWLLVKKLANHFFPVGTYTGRLSCAERIFHHE